MRLMLRLTCLGRVIASGAAVFATAAFGLSSIRAAPLQRGQTIELRLTVDPVRPPGTPAPARDGFRVCAGTSGDRDQLATASTAANGVATLTLHNVSAGAAVLVTVDKTSYTGLDQQIVIQSGQNHLNVQPHTGSGGPSCAGGSAPPTPPARAGSEISYTGTSSVAVTTPRVASFSINHRDRLDEREALYLFITYTGPQPTEFRVSETSGNFPEPWATWQPYVIHPTGYVMYPNLGFHTAAAKKTIYLQLRTGDHVSPTATTNVLVTKFFDGTGDAAFAAAKAQGFGFTSSDADNCFMTSDQNARAIYMNTRARLVPLPGALTCTFSLFSGASLKTDWKFMSQTFTNRMPGSCRLTMTRTPSLGATNMQTDLRVTSGWSELCEVMLSGVRLQGPADGRFQDAFSR